MKKPVAGIAYLLLVCFSIEAVFADSFVGHFIGQLDGVEYRLSISSMDDRQYEGNLRVGGERIPLNARRFGDRIAGQFGSAGDSFEFVAQMQGAALVLQDEDGEIIIFQRGSANASSGQEDGAVQSSRRQVFINRVQLNEDTLQTLESQGQVPIADGRYWYDVNTGAWGVEGGPTAGLIYPGLPLPTTMPADISGGGTGIFINGREIHPLDQQALYQLFGVTYQGNFWMDSQGFIGYIGGPAIANILQASQAAQSGAGGSTTHGYDSTYGARGTAAGGMYSGRTATGKSVFWYPGM